MNLFSSVLMGMTILFGVSAQMLLLDIRIKDLKGTQRTFFLVGNLLVLVVNVLLSFVLPSDQHMKIYVLVVHVPFILIFCLTTNISPVKVLFALFTAVFMIYPGNVVLNVLSRTAQWLYPTGFLIAYIAVCALMLVIIHRFFNPNFIYLNKNYSGISFLKLFLLPLTYNI